MLGTNNLLSCDHIVSTVLSVIVTNQVTGKELNQNPVPLNCLEHLEPLNIIHSIHKLNSVPHTAGVPPTDLTIFLAHGKTVQPSGQDHRPSSQSAWVQILDLPLTCRVNSNGLSSFPCRRFPICEVGTKLLPLSQGCPED